MRPLRAIVVGAIALATAPTALNAVPVVPNFTQGSMTSHTGERPYMELDLPGKVGIHDRKLSGPCR